MATEQAERACDSAKLKAVSLWANEKERTRELVFDNVLPAFDWFNFFPKQSNQSDLWLQRINISLNPVFENMSVQLSNSVAYPWVSEVLIKLVQLTHGFNVTCWISLLDTVRTLKGMKRRLKKELESSALLCPQIPATNDCWVIFLTRVSLVRTPRPDYIPKRVTSESSEIVNETPLCFLS